MSYIWTMIEDDYKEMVEVLKENKLGCRDHFGSLIVGEVCVEFVVIECNPPYYIASNTYVANDGDSAYASLPDGTPYSYHDELYLNIDTDDVVDIYSYEEFKNLCERKLEAIIKKTPWLADHVEVSVPGWR